MGSSESLTTAFTAGKGKSRKHSVVSDKAVKLAEQLANSQKEQDLVDSLAEAKSIDAPPGKMTKGESTSKLGKAKPRRASTVDNTSKRRLSDQLELSDDTLQELQSKMQEKTISGWEFVSEQALAQEYVLAMQDSFSVV